MDEKWADFNSEIEVKQPQFYSSNESKLNWSRKTRIGAKIRSGINKDDVYEVYLPEMSVCQICSQWVSIQFQNKFTFSINFKNIFIKNPD